MIRRGIRRVRGITRRPKNLVEQRALILLYHRVAKLRSDPWSLGVTPHRFAEHLEVLGQQTHPIRLEQLSQELLNDHVEDRSVVITFDDNYADNLYDAKPVLEHHNIPATCFLTTGYLGQEHEFWWDELERILLQPGVLPEVLHLSVNGNTVRWELGRAACYSEEDSRQPRYWRAWGSAYKLRHRLYRSLWELLYSLTEDERRKVLDELLAWGGVETVCRPTHRPLRLEEVADLAQGATFEIGAHTVTHPALPTLPVALQRHEVQTSKDRLEEILGHPVNSFSYPHGKLSKETVAIVREAGFAYACAGSAEGVECSTDLFQLPRTVVQDWDGDEFAKHLSRWFER